MSGEVTHRTFSVFVAGIPKPAGSKRPFLIRGKGGAPVFKNGRPVIVVTDTSGQAGKDWRGDVRAKVSEAYQGEPLTCRIQTRMDFVFARPKSHYRTGKNAATLRDNAPHRDDHLQDPDALKLARAVEDALTGIVWKDDNQLAGYQEKRWADPGETCGMHIFVSWAEATGKGAA